jgi:hypothetical protein
VMVLSTHPNCTNPIGFEVETLNAVGDAPTAQAGFDVVIP